MAFAIGQILTVADIVAAGGPDYKEGESKEQYYERVRKWAISQKIVISWLSGYPHFYGYVSWKKGDQMYPNEVEAMGGPTPFSGESFPAYFQRLQLWADNIGIKVKLVNGSSLPVYDGQKFNIMGITIPLLLTGLGIFLIKRKK
ncbi:MAG: hypothetical protein WAO71_03620 [Gallionella sp.]